MPAKPLQIETLVTWLGKCTIIDVRSPAEFEHAHIPGAVNLPLFNNEERKVVGTIYKQQSREQAIKKGLEYFGPKMLPMVEWVEQLMAATTANDADRPAGMPPKSIVVHCWRGGMRSAGVAWLLDLYGFKIFTLAGGYKSFRQWAHRQFAQPAGFAILGGYTGSGKTEIIQQLKAFGRQAIDLEKLASHKGSAFGSINMPAQPSQEMFENLLALDLNRCTQPEGNAAENGEEVLPHFEATKAPAVIWLEDESQRIGHVNLPLAFWEQMRRAPVFFLDIPFEERLNNIVKDYGKGDKEKLLNAIVRIKKRLGGLEAKTAVGELLEDNLVECFRILLKYYDKYYIKSLHTRDNWEKLVTYVVADRVDAVENANIVLARHQSPDTRVAI